jgi:hypothetical protein
VNRPDRDPALRTVARRVVAFAETELQSAFADALVRRVSTGYGLDVTDDERADVVRQLPDAAAGYDVRELDVLVGRLLAGHRAAAEGARARRETLAAFGERGGEAAGPEADDGPALSLTEGAPTATWRDPGRLPCAVAGVQLVFSRVPGVCDFSDDQAVAAAGVLANVYLHADWIRMFAAVDEAVRRLDDGALRVDEHCLLDALNCWREMRNGVTAAERARLVASVLGLPGPHLAADVTPDPLIQGLLDALLDAVNAACAADPDRGEPDAVVRGRLRRTRQAVRARLTSTVSSGAIMRIKQLLVQFRQARYILDALGPYLQGGPRPAAEGDPAHWAGVWATLRALLGDELGDGTDLYTGIVTADAWRVVFDWLDAGGDAVDCADLCDAAALLRPCGRNRAPAVSRT